VKLTTEELQILINVVSNANVRVRDANTFVALINKMSAIIDLDKDVPVKEKKNA